MELEEGDRFLGVACHQCRQPLVLNVRLAEQVSERPFDGAIGVAELRCPRCSAVGAYPVASFGIFTAHRSRPAPVH